MTRAQEEEFKRDWVDQEALRDFECISCLKLIPDPYQNHTCKHCKHCMCPNCQVMYALTYKLKKPHPLECQACRKPWSYGCRRQKGIKSVKIWDQLKVYCKFPSCRKIITNEDYKWHTNICPHNVNNCSLCITYKLPQEFHSRFCMTLSSTQKELQLKTQELRRMASELEDTKEMLKEAENKLKALQQ